MKKRRKIKYKCKVCYDLAYVPGKERKTGFGVVMTCPKCKKEVIIKYDNTVIY